MKYIVFLGDGMADEPIAELGGKTPLEVARTPNMDRMASRGITGLVDTVPPGQQPGSDNCNMGIMGYDAAQYYTGRAPLEAASMGIDLKPGDIAYRCNTVTISNSGGPAVMQDYSAGHITTEEAADIIATVDAELGGNGFKFYPGKQYRHLMVWEGGAAGAACTPPHDIADQEIANYLPKGDGADTLNRLMAESQRLLADHPVNKKRVAAGQRPASSIWLWGQGGKPALPAFSALHGITGAVISAVDLLQGIAICGGMEVIKVPGATGYIDTNYRGKAEYALDALNRHDFVYVHVEAADEAGHNGLLKEKIGAIEDIDAQVMGTVFKGLDDFGDWRAMVLPDHPTPIARKTHVNEPVPFALCGSDMADDTGATYSETGVDRGNLIPTAPQLFSMLRYGRDARA